MKKSVAILCLILLSSCASTNLLTGSTVKDFEQPQVVYECHDSDDGFNPAERGIAVYIEGGEKQSAVDVCEGLFLTEFYCEQGKLQHAQVICENGCSLGACIK